ncbi:MAG: EAL and HDOD domain-containing protein, partial [Terriglobales bacterium]
MAVVKMDTAPSTAPINAAIKLVARQPILDRAQRVFGYELLFRRDVSTNSCHDPKPEATTELIGDLLMLHDWDALAGGVRAFVNLTRADLLDGRARLLPNATAVIEVLESVAPDEEVLRVLRTLRAAGYQLALDDVTSAERLAPFSGIAHFAKVDLDLTSAAELKTIVPTARRLGMAALAEKVESRAQFRAAAALGFEYFQGYFFARPEMQQRRDLSTSELSRLRLLQVLHSSEFDVEDLDKLIRSDLTFSYKLLRYLNSATFGFCQPIHSIRHAITLMGENEVRRWASMIGLA